MKKKVMILFMGLIILSTVTSVSADSYAYERCDGTSRDIWVKVPLDMWYIDQQDGITEFQFTSKLKGNAMMEDG